MSIFDNMSIFDYVTKFTLFERYSQFFSVEMVGVEKY